MVCLEDIPMLVINSVILSNDVFAADCEDVFKWEDGEEAGECLLGGMDSMALQIIFHGHSTELFPGWTFLLDFCTFLQYFRDSWSSWHFSLFLTSFLRSRADF